MQAFSGGEAQNRTGDTMIFSHVLYQLSYLATEARCAHERGAESVPMLVPCSRSVNLR